jgi:hypothetical protein
MKKLIEIVKLTGEEELTISQFRQLPGEVLQQVELGMTFKIKRRGKVIAVLHKPEPNAFELGAALRETIKKRIHK